MRHRCYVFHFLRHAHSDIWAHEPSSFVLYLHPHFIIILTPSIWGESYWVYWNVHYMLNYTLPYYLEPKCLYAWEVTQVSNSSTLILFQELKFPYAWEVYKCRYNAFVLYFLYYALFYQHRIHLDGKSELKLRRHIRCPQAQIRRHNEKWAKEGHPISNPTLIHSTEQRRRIQLLWGLARW